MGLYIEGMEMPKRGMVVNIYADGRVTNHFDEFGKTIGKAVHVPPHGDLIDRDKLPIECITFSKRKMYRAGTDVVFVKDILDAPTIIKAEGKGINVLGKEEGET